MKVIGIVTVLSIFPFCFAQAQQLVESYDIETIVSGALYHDSLIKSFRGEFTVSRDINKDLGYYGKEFIKKYIRNDDLTKVEYSMDYSAEVATDGRELSLSYTAIKEYVNAPKTYEIKVKQVYNGEYWESLTSMRDLPDGIYSITGVVGAMPISDEFNPFLIFEDINIIDFGLFLSKHAQSNTLKLIEHDKGKDVVRVQIQLEEKTYDLWISIKTMFRPIKIQITSDNTIRSIEYEYQKYNDQLWFPEKKIINERENNGTLIYSLTLSVQSGYHLNTALQEELFEIDYPHGVIIHDNRSNQDYYYTPELYEGIVNGVGAY